MEIEARVKVDDLSLVKQKLLSLGASFTSIQQQDDIIFKKAGTEQEVQKPGCFILRIRRTDEVAKLTFKALTETAGSWVEHETVIANPDEMESMLLKAGFAKNLELSKQREHGELNGVNLCLDNITQLGTFLEVEIISEDVSEGKTKLIELLQTLGFSEQDIIHDGYVAMLYKAKGVTFENTG